MGKQFISRRSIATMLVAASCALPVAMPSSAQAATTWDPATRTLTNQLDVSPEVTEFRSPLILNLSRAQMQDGTRSALTCTPDAVCPVSWAEVDTYVVESPIHLEVDIRHAMEIRRDGATTNVVLRSPQTTVPSVDPLFHPTNTADVSVAIDLRNYSGPQRINVIGTGVDIDGDLQADVLTDRADWELRLETGTGNDTIDARNASPAPRGAHHWIRTHAGNDLVRGPASNVVPAPSVFTVDGGAGADRLYGGHGSDQLSGGLGNDTINTGPRGDDGASGGPGNDRITTGSGNDGVAGDDSGSKSGGKDLIITGSGNDTINAGPGNDRVFSGAGNDSFITWQIGSDFGNDYLNAGPGGDRIGDRVGPRNTIAAGAGNDQINLGTLSGPFGINARTTIVQCGWGRDIITDPYPGRRQCEFRRHRGALIPL